MIIKYAIALAVIVVLAAVVAWAFVPPRYLPNNRARHLRIRLHLRLHPGKGFAHVFSLWLRWGRLAALRRSARIRPSLPLRYRIWDPRGHSVDLGRAHYRHRLHVPLEEHLLVMAPPRTYKTAFLADVIMSYPGPVIATSTKPDLYTLTGPVRAQYGHRRDRPAPASMPHTVRFPVCAVNPQASAVKVRNDGAVNSGPNTASTLAREAGSGSVTSGSIGTIPFHRRFPGTRGPRAHGGTAQDGTSTTPPRPRRPRPATAIMDSVPDTPDPQTRQAVTQRIIAHIARGWPRLGEPIVRHRGQFCYVSARLPGEREPAPILRLRYQGSADQWAIGIYLASSDRYSESELPTSFGPKTGTPEEGVDDTFVLYAGPESGR